MKMRKTISLLLACLAGACFFNSQATAGTLIGSVIPLGFDTSGMTPDFFDLTAQGTLDWAKYGLDPDPAAFNQKSGGVNQISDKAPVGSTNTLYGGEIIGPSFSWSDGTPTPTGSGAQFSDYNCSLGNGLQFTVTADTTTKYLLVYAGIWGGRLRCEAFLSDNSATGYTNNSVFTDVDDMFAGVFQLQFAANSPGQTLTVQLIVDQEGVDGIYTSANLQAAALKAAPPPPEIVVPPASQTNYSGYAAQFTATARGGLPLSYHWSKEVNGVYVPLTDGGQVSGSGTPTLTISNLVFANATNYYVVVTNNWGAVTSSVANLTILSLTGSLLGTPLPAPATVDLTAAGSLDWAAWGLNVDTDFDQKAGGTNQITNITLIGPGPNGPHRYNNALALKQVS